MIFTIVRISMLRLSHNLAELLLTFIVPLLFFSIFAWIFGSRDSDGGTPRIKVAIADLSHSDQSNEIVNKLTQARSLRFMGDKTTANSYPLLANEKAAENWVRRGMVTAVIVLRPNSRASTNAQSVESFPIQAEIFADSFDQVATQILGAVVQKAVVASQQEYLQELAQQRIGQIAVQRASFTQIDAAAIPIKDVAEEGIAEQPVALKLPEIPVRDVLGENKTNPVIAMYAAGIAVMFSLFSATTVSGSLLEERENSTLERLLCSQLTIDQLLMGKWLYLTALGCTQITFMFLWGWFAFGVDLFSHLTGFAVMTLVTSAAAASFALMLATLCKTRIQLGWVSTIVILVMSALGGSMVPRYLMSEAVQRVGMFTFNAWALEGYSKIFWRDLKLTDINLELTVMVATAFVMLIAARIFAIRWERT